MPESRCPVRSVGPAVGTCPACGGAGKSADMLTLKALLTPSALQRFEPGDYRFCAAPECDVVYFVATRAAFGVADLQVRVWQKEPPGRRMLCYCFDENEADMAAEIDRTGCSLAADRIRRHIEAGRCACEVRNPKGSCCLGDVTGAADRLRHHRGGDLRT